MRIKAKKLSALEPSRFSITRDLSLDKIETSVKEFRSKLNARDQKYLNKVLTFSVQHLHHEDSLLCVFYWLQNMSKKINLTKGYMRPEDLQEVLSLTLDAVISSRKKFDPQKGKAVSWMLKIFQNTARNFIRGKYYSKDVPLEEVSVLELQSEEEPSPVSNKMRALITLVTQVTRAMKTKGVATVLEKNEEKYAFILKQVFEDLFEGREYPELLIDFKKTFSGRQVISKLLTSLSLRSKDDRFLQQDPNEILEIIRKAYKIKAKERKAFRESILSEKRETET